MRQSSNVRFKLIIAGISVVVVYVLAMLLLPAPKPTVSLTVKNGALETGQADDFVWPSTGGAAIGAAGYGVLAVHNADTPMPTASIAKVILAIAVLREKPLQLNQPGPTITFGAKDVALYTADLAKNGSVVPVNDGETMTEYQLLQALLLPSGNNIASSMAIWAFGSEQNYLTYASNMLQQMGLSKTHLDDVSGYSPKTVSTPRELVMIGQEALKNPVLAQVVAQKQAMLPGVGAVSNVNADLGLRDINGIKTGNTDEAGGCLLFSATRTVSGKKVTLIGAVQSMPDLQQALQDAPDLVDNGFLNLVYVSGLPSQVGTMTPQWGSAVNIVPKSDVSQVVWAGTPVSRSLTVAPGFSGTVGQAKVGDHSTDLTLESAIPQPNMLWRLTHPVQIIQGLFAK